MPENFLFRADASTEIGTGHVMRCLALAQAAQEDGYLTTFVMSKDANGLIERLRAEKCNVIELKSDRGTADDAKETAKLAKEMGAHLIVDGYAFADEYQKVLKESDIQFLLVDDYGQATSYSADFILNQNSYAESLRDIYEKRSGSEPLLGSKYTMLRREFRDLEPHPSVPNNAKSILVTLGGSDPDNVTLRVVELLSQIEDINPTIIVGGMNPYLDDIKARSNGINVLTDVKDMPALISEAELAITAGGSTTYEMAYMGVPTVAITIANNQQPVVADLDERGVVKSIGKPDEFSDNDFLACLRDLLANESERKSMSEKGMKLIDGYGAYRVCMKAAGKKLWLRPSKESECKMIFDWANDPEARAVSFNSDPIPWEDHVNWYENKMTDANYYLLLAINEDDEPVGQVRFEVEGDNAAISVSVDPNQRGKGYGTSLITQGCDRILSVTDIKVVDAYIKPDNEASKAVFTKAGFEESAKTEIKGQPAEHFILAK